MGLSQDIRQKLINSFKVEQSEHVQKINHGLLTLEKGADSSERQALLKEIFREAHSLKGAARAVGFTTIENLGHSLEELLLNAKEGHLTFSPELFDLLYQALDAIDLLVAQVDSGDTAPPAKVLTLLAALENAKESIGQNDALPQTAIEKTDGSGPESTPGRPDRTPADHTPIVETPTVPNGQDETIRVSVGKLDALMNQFSELLGAKIRAEQRLAEVREMQTTMAGWHKTWQAMRGHYNSLLRANDHSSHNGHTKDVHALVDFVGQNQEYLRSLNTQSNLLYRRLSNDTMRLSLIIDELQEEIKRVRMLPLSTITATFGRMVRDLAREQEKSINLTITGGDTELDKRVLEQIKDPLIHLLRNAIDHGLEKAVEREQAGKSATGNIVLAAGQQGNNVVITITDDGGGLNPAAIRASAVRKGWVSQVEAEKLSEAEIINFIFNAGFSTSKIITGISGRGVGLDVVRQNVEALHGTLNVDFEPGLGTTFTLILPLTLASSRGLLVQVGEQLFALPLTTVEHMLQIKPADINRVSGREAITFQEKPVALARLADLLQIPAGVGGAERLTVVIVGSAEKQLGLVVDALVGEQEIVIKAMGRQLSKVKGIAGATVLGSGQVILVLHMCRFNKAGYPKYRACAGSHRAGEQR